MFADDTLFTGFSLVVIIVAILLVAWWRKNHKP